MTQLCIKYEKKMMVDARNQEWGNFDLVECLKNIPGNPRKNMSKGPVRNLTLTLP